MYYFLNASIPRFCSGIEHAEFKRLANFTKHGVPAKIVTCQYERDVSDILKTHHVDYDHYVNLYDYFCGNCHVTPRKLSLQQLVPTLKLTVDAADKTVVHGYSGSWQCCQFHLRTDGSLDIVDCFDGDGQLVRKDFYDTRGFKGFSQFFATSDDASTAYLALESFYSHTGRTGIEITYRRRNNGVVSTAYRVIAADGREWQLMNPEQMYTLLLDALNVGGDTFISDRSNICNRAMINMTTPARKIEHFHNIHFADYHDPMHSRLTYPSISETELLAGTDMIITPTKAQAADMRARLRTQVPIVSIPVGSVPKAQLEAPHIAMSKRIRGKVIIVARLYYEKHLDDAVWAFKKAHDQLYWLTLDIYGYGDGDTNHRDEKLVRKIVADQGLQDVVQFKGYTNDIDKVYDQAQVMLLSSRFEGFVLAILEAAAHGVPTISYDTHYGPAELIEPGKSGELLPYGDVDGLAAKLVAAMKDTHYLAQLSEGAYKRAQDFSEEAVWAQWQAKVVSPKA